MGIKKMDVQGDVGEPAARAITFALMILVKPEEIRVMNQD